MKKVTFLCEKFPSLGFYVNNSYRRFVGGKFVTEDEVEIEKCRKLKDVVEAGDRKKQEPKPEPKPEKVNSSVKKKSTKKPKYIKKDK